MSHSTLPKRFAILVGINKYPSNGSRRLENGEPVNLRQLSACVNDVHAVRDVAQQRFRVDSLQVLTAEANSAETLSRESASSLPTYNNIKDCFQRVSREASAGDVFLFYFSGHGAKLPLLKNSPQDGRETDPSLLTYDYCCGKPAIRGWQLNIWLKALHDKQVQIVVILDSCYSAVCWRGSDFRTPDEWEMPPNTPADEEAVDNMRYIADDIIDGAVNRDTKLDQIWGIDPKGFTLMTACGSEQLAEENWMPTSTGRTRHGIFTFHLLQQLSNEIARLPTYRILRDQIEPHTEKQTPQVYGRDRVTFFGNREQFSAVSNVVRVNGSQVIVPLGKMHGIHKGTEFMTCDSSRCYSIQIDHVETLTCRQNVQPEVAEFFKQHSEVILARPSLGEAHFEIRLPLATRSISVSSFRDYLANRILGHIVYATSNVSTGCSNSLNETSSLSIRSLASGRGGYLAVEIVGHASLLGYSGPVRGLSLEGRSVDETAKRAAACVAHLIRFAQILNLHQEAYQQNPGFVVSVTCQNGDRFHNLPSGMPNGTSCQENEDLTYTFQNNSDQDLYITILSLGPGFHIRQLSADSLRIRSGDHTRFKFHSEIPPRLQAYTAALHRDIIRTIVTSNPIPSFKGLEIPNIWDMCEDMQSDLRCIARWVEEVDVKWWIDDRYIITRRARLQ